MNEIWTEKYRPKTLDEVIGQKNVVDRLKGYVEARNLSHLMFAGTPGTGKTTCALALARELFGENWRSNFLELNASDERGIDIVRGRIKEFAKTVPLNSAEFKIIFLDEADALTSEAQGALRRTMETFSRTCRFIISCNYSSKIIDPIQSRCAVFRFRPLGDADIREYLEKIAKAEGLDIEEGALDALLHACAGDMRRSVNTLQTAAAISTSVTIETVAKVTGSPHGDEIKEVLVTAISGKFQQASSALFKLMVDYGLSGQDTIRLIHRAVHELPLEIDKKIRIIEKVGETEFRITEGSNDKIQLDVLIAALALYGPNRPPCVVR